MQRKAPAVPRSVPLPPLRSPGQGCEGRVLAQLCPCPSRDQRGSALLLHPPLCTSLSVTAEPSAGAGARPLLPAGTLGSGSLSGTVCHAGRGTGPSLGVTKGGEREQVQWSLHTHMEAVPEDCKSVRGRLAPPSALHARALTLAGAMPADREGVGEARVGRNCC